MDANATTAIVINEEKEECRNILSESLLYLDTSLLARENFVRYLASIVLR